MTKKRVCGGYAQRWMNSPKMMNYIGEVSGRNGMLPSSSPSKVNSEVHLQPVRRHGIKTA